VSGVGIVGGAGMVGVTLGRVGGQGTRNPRQACACAGLDADRRGFPRRFVAHAMVAVRALAA